MCVCFKALVQQFSPNSTLWTVWIETSGLNSKPCVDEDGDGDGAREGCDHADAQNDHDDGHDPDTVHDHDHDPMGGRT